VEAVNTVLMEDPAEAGVVDVEATA